MTSYDFEKAAKNAVRKEFAKGGINFTISDIDFVWFAHELGYKKCTIGEHRWETNMQKSPTTEIKMRCMWTFIRK